MHAAVRQRSAGPCRYTHQNHPEDGLTHMTTDTASKNTTSLDAAMRRLNLPCYDPDVLTLVTDEAHCLYDPRVHRAVDEPTVVSIMAEGVIVPALVRKNGQLPDGTPVLEVIDGRQRVKAAREANKRLRAAGKPLVDVPCRMWRGTQDELMLLIATCNELRSASKPSERAQLMARMDRRGISHENIGAAFGCSRQTVQQVLKLADLAPPLLKAMDDGNLPQRVAMTLAAMPDTEQVATYDKMKAEGKLVGKAAQQAADGAVGPKRGRVRAKAKKCRPAKDVEAQRKLLLKEAKGASQAKQERIAIAVAALAWCEGDDIDGLTELL